MLQAKCAWPMSCAKCLARCRFASAPKKKTRRMNFCNGFTSNLPYISAPCLIWLTVLWRSVTCSYVKHSAASLFAQAWPSHRAGTVYGQAPDRLARHGSATKGWRLHLYPRADWCIIKWKVPRLEGSRVLGVEHSGVPGFQDSRARRFQGPAFDGWEASMVFQSLNATGPLAVLRSRIYGV